MAFEALAEQTTFYMSREGQRIELAELPPKVAGALLELIRFYNWNPPYPQFRTYWRDRTSPIGPYLEENNDVSKLLKRVGKDMEVRLGISQGRLEEE